MNPRPVEALLGLSDTPQYNIKAVALQSGVHVSTLRAWQTRYGFPLPGRSGKGHRRYSQRDVALLGWLRERTEEGVSISQAVAELQQLQREAELASQTIKAPPPPPGSDRVEAAQMASHLLDALMKVDFPLAQQLFNEVCERFPLEVALFEVFQPVMVEVGEMWARGTVHTTSEQLATTLLRQWLVSLLQNSRATSQQVRLICGCVPGEQHDMGILMFALLMQRRGHEVLFLGSNLSLSGLDDLLARLAPVVLCLNATLIEHVPDLLRIAHTVETLRGQGHALALIFGGRVFHTHPALLSRVPGTFLGNDLPAAIERASRLVRDIERGHAGAHSLAAWLAERGPGVADRLDGARELVCNTVALRLAREFPDLGPPMPGRTDISAARQQMYNDTPRRFHRMLQVVLRCHALDVVDQEYRWTWTILPRFGVLRHQLLDHVRWYFEAAAELVPLEPTDRAMLASLAETVLERIERSIAPPHLAEQAA